MKKTPISLLILLCALFFTSGVIAQNKPLACQTDDVGGFQWENGQWVMSKYVNQKFILVQTKDGLTLDSVAKAMLNDFPNQVFCRNESPQISCMDRTGTYLFFDPRTLKGGISRTFGSTRNESKRDSVSIAVFSCTPF